MLTNFTSPPTASGTVLHDTSSAPGDVLQVSLAAVPGLERARAALADAVRARPALRPVRGGPVTARWLVAAALVGAVVRIEWV